MKKNTSSSSAPSSGGGVRVGDDEVLAVLDPNDIEAYSARAEALEASQRLIREHLHGHLRNNPDATFTSW